MKRITGIVCATALIACVIISGCKASETAEKGKYTPKGTYPIVTEPITVNIMVAQPPCVEDFNTNEFSKFMEEKTGVKVNWIMVPEQAAAICLTLS